DKWVARYSGRGVAPCDFDGDGRLDLYVTNYSLHPNALYSETGTGLRNIAWETDTAGVPSENAVETYYAHSIGACWADLDGDCRPDLLAPNFAHPRVINISDRSWIYFNSSEPGKPAFKGSRMIPFYETLTSPAAADFDGDGDMDFFLSATYADRPSHLFRNTLAESGNLAFNDIVYASGALVYNGWGCVWRDYDGNGTPDLFATGDGKLVVLKNPVRANFVRVRIAEPGVGFGAWVTVESGGKKRTYCLNGAKGSGDQEPMEVCAGLGASTSADRVTISFAGKTATKENIPAGSTVTFSLSELKAR
ncbi:MAG: CRTAC1 family protein, partial [Candidatus Brocadiia bacterium]